MNTDHLTHEFQQEIQSDPVKRYALQILANNLDEQQWKQLPAYLVPAIVDAMLQFNAQSYGQSCGNCKNIDTNICGTCRDIIIRSEKFFQTNFEQK